jgi:8-oxo-dGTP pyrophosphatase MutT (NUDIX family)
MDKIKVVCRALIIDDKKRVLFVKKTGSDFWSLPGGKLETDDASVQMCLVRELQEELGIYATIKNIRFVQELHKNDTRYVELIWEATLAGDPTLAQKNIYETSSGELTDIKWIIKSDLPDTNIKPEFLRELI